MAHNIKPEEWYVDGLDEVSEHCFCSLEHIISQRWGILFCLTQPVFGTNFQIISDIFLVVIKLSSSLLCNFVNP